MRTRAILIALAVTLAGCGPLPSPSQASVAIRHRNASEQRFTALIRSSADDGGSNLEGIGEVCFPMDVPWSVVIGAEGPDGAVGEYMPLLSSADVSDPMDAVIWIDIAEDGTVTWDEGTPEWAMERGIADGCRASVP